MASPPMLTSPPPLPCVQVSVLPDTGAGGVPSGAHPALGHLGDAGEAADMRECAPSIAAHTALHTCTSAVGSGHAGGGGRDARAHPGRILDHGARIPTAQRHLPGSALCAHAHAVHVASSANSDPHAVCADGRLGVPTAGAWMDEIARAAGRHRPARR